MPVMSQSESDQVEELLMLWYYKTKSEREKLGYSGVSAGFQFAETSDLYADQDEIDRRIDCMKADDVGGCIASLPGVYRSIIGNHAANKAGPSVYIYPRMTKEEQHAEYLVAKSMLLPMMVFRGLVKLSTG